MVENDGLEWSLFGPARNGLLSTSLIILELFISMLICSAAGLLPRFRVYVHLYWYQVACSVSLPHVRRQFCNYSLIVDGNRVARKLQDNINYSASARKPRKNMTAKSASKNVLEILIPRLSSVGRGKISPLFATVRLYLCCKPCSVPGGYFSLTYEIWLLVLIYGDQGFFDQATWEGPPFFSLPSWGTCEW